MLLRCGLFRSALRPAAYSSPPLAAMAAPLASSAAAARPLSPTSSLHAGQPAAKRQRTSNHHDDDDADYAPESKPATKTPRKRTSQLPYHTGMHLAPMVRIGTLPLRLIGEFFPLLFPLSSRLTNLARSSRVWRRTRLGSRNRRQGHHRSGA